MKQIKLFPQLTFLVICVASLVFAEYATDSEASLLWGPYRSNLYMGVRPRGLPHSLMTGLMWYNIDDYQGLSKIRHACDTNDVMQGYGWERYDPRSGGVQVFHDTEQHLELTTEFIKNKEGTAWAIRVKGVPDKLPDGGPRKTTLVFYAGLEGQGKLDLKSEDDPSGLAGDIELVGKSRDLGSFDLRITEGKNKHPKSTHKLAKSRVAEKARYISLRVPDDNVWKARDIFVTLMQDSIQKYYEQYSEDPTLPPWVITSLESIHKMKGNLHLVQRTFEGPFEFDIIFNQKRSNPKFSSASFISVLNKSEEVFESKFAKAFTFQAPFSKELSKYGGFAREMFSNLIGGVGYFYGSSIVDRSYSEAYEEEEERFWEAAEQSLKEGKSNAKEERATSLLTSVPSRPFFPRGFYWDEGFHLIPILEYDADLALEILKSWFALIDDDGWIAREQILGPEARSKVPEEFQTQFPHYANPPTLMLLLSSILEKFKAVQASMAEDEFYEGKKQQEFEFDSMVGGEKDKEDPIISGTAHWRSPELVTKYLRDIYPELQAHYEWFRRTQRGNIKEWDRTAFSSREGYRWRGRTPSHCLTSGLDDYPRATTPHTGELHVDLISWIGMMTRSMRELAEFLDIKDDAEDYKVIETAIEKNIADLHWSAKDMTYCDKTIDDFEEDSFVCHKGYVSLFPFLLNLVPVADADEKLSPLLDMISDPDQLWTPYGIRSLSASDEYFGTEENYWRGPIWVNINYMILKALRRYGENPDASLEFREKAANIYKDLRVNIVNNVYDNWEKTGFAWEQYDSKTGKGQGVKHFLGWTSLTVMIMALPETLTSA